MRKNLFISSLAIMVASLLLIGCSNQATDKSDTIVIISTNDIHSQLANFPRLATAVAECRDTATLILLDAGDRFTGNAYVDIVEHHAPIYELMNSIGYDLAIFGNHEFDKGSQYLTDANKQAKFDLITANILSDTSSFVAPKPYKIYDYNGVKIGFVGVIGNYDSNNHPAGNDESFKGLTFLEPQETAAKYSYLKKDSCDILILVTHMGLDRDIEFANSSLSSGYDMVIGAHSHSIANDTINNKLVVQAQNKLKMFGASVIKKDKDGVAKIVSYKNIMLKDYDLDEECQGMVDGYMHNPLLSGSVAIAKEEFKETGLRNFFTTVLRDKTKSDIGFYHSGGVRLASIEAGEVSLGTIYSLEPFNSSICTMEMTVEQIEKMIIAKFNDTINVGESHCIDLNSTIPYTVVKDEKGDAKEVIFPTLVKGKTYKIAIGDYVFNNYKGLEYTNGNNTGILITDAMVEFMKREKEIVPDNKKYQNIR